MMRREPGNARGGSVWLAVLRRDHTADAISQHIYRHAIVTPFRDNHVGIALARLDKLQVHRAHRVQILVNDRVHAATTLGYVTLQPPDEPNIRVGIDKDS